ncbi:M28 family metallopeptidase [Flavisolibacter nicotianae]|uniref:M28 family metallopeptidase n=1 Tax=Flavisolibacter nicotianae TaxID=2364882 RepID=UPI000EB053AB|nr:M20/M25/M40 family metallo-hydrolase [Flavisolibacter nicotianae]
MRKFSLLALANLFFCAAFAQKEGDEAFINKLKEEGFQHSQVMDHAFYLTDVNGPRLTASPGFMRAATWAKQKLESWGLQNVQIESWGEFGKSWQQERCYVAMTKPYYVPLMAQSVAWAGSTPGNKITTADIVLVKAKDSVELMQYAGKLKGKVVMMWRPDTLKMGFKADANRFSDEELEKMAKAEPAQPRQGPRQGNPSMLQAFRDRMIMTRVFNNLAIQEKPALIISMGRGTEGTIFVQGGSNYKKESPLGPANVTLSSDDYLRLQRLVNAGIPVELEMDVRTKFSDKDPNGYNVIAEIPGTDPKLKDEVVMLGAHLDSWQGATGATDNAAGSAVMMEAMRLLKQSNFKPRRTIRIALWGGEEQGLFGSRNYVKTHVGDPATMQLQPAQEKISAYYNVDNGTGKIRGVYLQGNEAVRPIFAKWLEPFKELGASTLTISNTGGTDHLSFDAVGVPGFQFIQDEIEYDTRTHHSNMDTYDHLLPEDLKQASTIVAAFVYNTSQRDEKLPRKELPKPRGEGRAAF